MEIKGKTIMIFGGSGSLGNKLIDSYLADNRIINYSRDENKHWLMELKYKSDNLTNIIGDIRCFEKVQQSLIRTNPNIVIVAAALKHVDRCEFESNECLATNILGLQNILKTMEINRVSLTNVETICFISTDKACSPVNIYGMSKAICENLMVEQSKYIKDIKLVTVRYGNILNSRGSIIPILEKKCTDPNCNQLTLTDPRMTRFVMTLEDSIQLIEYAIIHGCSGEIIIPKLRAMYIKDLMELFAEKYHKPIIVTGLRAGEKINETLINDTQSMRTVIKGVYYHIQPTYVIPSTYAAPYTSTPSMYISPPTYVVPLPPRVPSPTHVPSSPPIPYEYHSGQEILSKIELHSYLKSLLLI